MVALIIVLGLYGLARLPEPSELERRALAERFHFTPVVLPAWTDAPQKTIRAVHPRLQGIAAWISSVGAGVALNDLDHDGLPNDLCHVDPRTDQVVVAPVPGTGLRYEPIVLDPAPLAYDAATMAPMGCLPGDLDEDGAMDLLVYYWGRTPVAFLHRNVEGAVGYRPREVVYQDERWFTNAATLADIDGDGHSDLVIGNYFADGAHILDAAARSDEATEMQHSMSRAYNGGSVRFLLWQSGLPLRFRDTEPALVDTVRHGWTLALGAADLDGDLLPEVYLANDFGPDRLLHNRSIPGRVRFEVLTGERGFTTPPSKVLGRDSFKGMGVDFADLNGDGWLDIYVSNIAAEYALEESHFLFVSTGDIEGMAQGRAPYVDRSEALGLSRSDWGWDTRLADLNNDGTLEALQATGFVKGEVNRWPELQELALTNDELLRHPTVWPEFLPGDDLSGHAHNPFFVQGSNGRYVDIAPQLGLDQPHVSRGIAVADVEGDGDLDYAVANQWAPSVFYRNECPNCGAALQLRLLLPIRPSKTQVYQDAPPDIPARPAIGAQAQVTLPGRRLTAQVDGGSGHSGKRSQTLHFGLGAVPAQATFDVALRWRDGSGRIRHQSLSLQPGRYTVILGSQASSEEVQG